MTASKYDIFLKVSHIPGKSNHVADLLSRWHHTTDNFKKLKSLLPFFTWEKIEDSHFQLDENI